MKFVDKMRPTLRGSRRGIFLVSEWSGTDSKIGPWDCVTQPSYPTWSIRAFSTLHFRINIKERDLEDTKNELHEVQKKNLEHKHTVSEVDSHMSQIACNLKKESRMSTQWLVECKSLHESKPCEFYRMTIWKGNKKYTFKSCWGKPRNLRPNSQTAQTWQKLMCWTCWRNRGNFRHKKKAPCWVPTDLLLFALYLPQFIACGGPSRGSPNLTM